MNIWLSSDFHFLHKNIAGPKVSSWKDGYRDFDSIFDMNECLFSNINKYVQQEDVLYFLGDFAFGDHRKIPEYRNRIVCNTIHFLRGNHDKHVDKYSYLFNSVRDVYIGPLGQHQFTLSHYAHRVWQGSHKGHLHCYGHSHNSLENHPYGRSMDVGVDSAYAIFKEYRPFHINEIVKILEKRPIAFVDHHKDKTD